MTTCIMHEDLDGYTSAAVVYTMYGKNCKYIEMDYSRDVPFDQIESNEQIIIVDFSLQKPGEWEKLREITPNTIWIDHHSSSIKNAPDFMKDAAGIRDVGGCGAMLTWKYFYPHDRPPEIIELVDKWDRNVHNEDPKVLNFVFGMEAEDITPFSQIWELLLPVWNLYSNVDAPIIQAISENGEIIIEYERYKNIKRANKLAYEVEFEGYRCIAINVALTGRKVFESIKKKYDIWICHYYDGKQHTVSLYSEGDLRVDEIAEKYLGGGHPNASGFQCNELPWLKEK